MFPEIPGMYVINLTFPAEISWSEK